MPLTSSSKVGFRLGLQPAPAWAAILSLAIFSVLAILIGAGKFLYYLFPAGALAVGLFLYRRYPVLYLSFTWWIWFLVPLLARLVDFQSGMGGGRQFIIATPYLVTMLTVSTLIQQFPKAYKQGGLPFILAFIGVFYSLLIGLSHYLTPEANFTSAAYTPMTVGIALLGWLPAIMFGFHLFMNWRDYPAYSQNMQRTFLWGVLVTGVYGIVQYLIAPEWDRFWLKNAEELQFCCGAPEPLMMRVWSTSNTPATFSSMMTAGLLLLFSCKDTLRIPAAVAGFLSFLLSSVRLAWGAWFIGFLAVLTSMKPRFQMRLLVTILVLVLCLLPLTTVEPFSEVISTRFETLTKLQQDQSLSERSELYSENLNNTISDGLGRGMGGSLIVDAGILDVLSTLGWLGIIPYMGGVVLLLFSMFQYTEARFDPFVNAARAISLSIFAMLPGTNTMMIIHGMLFWGFAGMTMAAHKYYQHQSARRSSG